MEPTPSEVLVESENPYGEAYYQSGCGLPYARNEHWLWFFSAIAENLIRCCAPRRVLDVGCAMGMLMEAFWDRGVEARGIEISSYALDHARPDMRQFCKLQSAAEPIEGRYDLVTCIEVLEHMPESDARAAIRNMTAVTDRILFSSTPSDFYEPTHVNVQPPIYWLRAFAANGFWPETRLDMTFVAPHAILFSKRPPQQEFESDDILILFAEMLRIRAALVEREQRIGKLAEAVRAQTTALKEQPEPPQPPEPPEINLALPPADIDEAPEIASPAAEPEPEPEISLEAACSQQIMAGRLVSTMAALQATQQERDHLAGLTAAARQEVKQLSNSLYSITNSPGWRLLSGYRRWLAQATASNRLVRRYWEPSIRWVLGKTNLTPSSTPASGPSGAMLPAAINQPGELSYQQWIEMVEPSPAELGFQGRMALQLPDRPLISVVVPVYRIPLPVLEA